MLKFRSHPLLSETALSNLYTMGVAAKKDDRQAIPIEYTMPSHDTRLLRAKLLLEEVMETVKDLGFEIIPTMPNQGGGRLQTADDLCIVPANEPHLSLSGVIDGCCDTIYVAVGTMCALGAPDRSHMNEVNRANNEKFPKGNAIIYQPTGKFMKPAGWTSPNHEQFIENDKVNLREISEELIQYAMK